MSPRDTLSSIILKFTSLKKIQHEFLLLLARSFVLIDLIFCREAKIDKFKFKEEKDSSRPKEESRFFARLKYYFAETLPRIRDRPGPSAFATMIKFA